jgi:tetratricopeptide (TPR) repeat protein
MKFIVLFVLTVFMTTYCEERIDNLIARGKYKQVIKYINKKYKDKSDEEILYNFGLAQEHIGNYEEALNCYHLIVRTCPENRLVLMSLGRVYSQLNEFQKAYDYTLRSIVKDSITKFMLLHAYVCFKLNKIEEAKFIYEKYRNNKESNILGYIYFMQKQYKKAIPYLISHLKTKNVDEAALKIAFCYAFFEQYDSSIYYLSIDFGRKRERLQKAEQDAEEMHKKYPMNKKIIMLLVHINVEQNSLNDAMEYCKLISYIDPNDVKALYKRADIYVLKKEIEQARDFYLKGSNLIKAQKGLR